MFHFRPGVDLGVELFGVDTALYSSLYFYLTFLLVPGICVLPDFAWKVCVGMLLSYGAFIFKHKLFKTAGTFRV